MPVSRPTTRATPLTPLTATTQSTGTAQNSTGRPSQPELYFERTNDQSRRVCLGDPISLARASPRARVRQETKESQSRLATRFFARDIDLCRDRGSV